LEFEKASKDPSFNPLAPFFQTTNPPGAAMPHIIVKLWPGKSERQKTSLAEQITQDVMTVFGYGEESVSVAFEEIEPREWGEGLSTRHREERKESLQEAGLHDVSGRRPR
jgi:4-oxalocrotonate tautomerase